MKLTSRLKKIADFVEQEDKVADIGTDHGYIPVYLKREKKVDKIIASDINELPLKNASKYIKSAGLSEDIELRLGNGMEVLDMNEVDTVILAGMGGILISEIMEKDKNLTESIKKFILQPMVGRYELGKYLEKNSFKIENEVIAKEGEKIYQIIKVRVKDSEDSNFIIKKSEAKESLLDDEDLKYEISRKLIYSEDENLEEFLLKKIEKLDRIIESIEKNSEKTNFSYLNKMIKKREKLLGVIKSDFKKDFR